MAITSAKVKCPKCGGTVFFERNTSYNHEKKRNERAGWCLQCGYTVCLYKNIPSQDKERATI